VATVEARHTGEIQANYDGLLPGFFICEGAPCAGIRQAEDGDGGCASGDGQVNERGVVADEEIDLFEEGRGDFDAASACHAVYGHLRVHLIYDVLVEFGLFGAA
jgi:hypothetical protein